MPSSLTVMQSASSASSASVTSTRSIWACFTALMRSSRTDSNSSVRMSFRLEVASGSADTSTTSPYFSRVWTASQARAAESPELCRTGG